MKIGFFQSCKTYGVPPHIAMALFIEDLTTDGHVIHCSMIYPHAFEALLDILKREHYDLIFLDSIFVVREVNAIKKRFPELPVVLGGSCARALFTNSLADFAIIGASREGVKAIVKYLDGRLDMTEVPNTLFKDREGRIDFTGIYQEQDIEREIFPFKPYLHWNVPLVDEKKINLFQDVSITAEFGCPYKKTVESPLFACEDLNMELSGNFTPGAQEILKHHYKNFNRGCTFCAFKFQGNASLKNEHTINILLQQAQYLQNEYGTTSFSIQSEDPFRFLGLFLQEACTASLEIRNIGIRTRADLLLKREKQIIDCLDLASEKGFTVTFQQIGFENYCSNHLELFNKNITAAENFSALEFLRKLKGIYEKYIDIGEGHGMILITPWSTLEDIEANLEVLASYDDIFTFTHAGAELIFYDDLTPLFRKAQREGLLERSEENFGWDFHCKDPLSEKFRMLILSLYQEIESYLGGLKGGDGPECTNMYRILRAVFASRIIASLREGKQTDDEIIEEVRRYIPLIYCFYEKKMERFKQCSTPV